MAKQIPIIGEWYQDAVEDVLFEVVAVDDHSGTIEIQYEDGEVGEFDVETWGQMVLLPAQAPEDWRVSYELSGDDGANPDAVFIPDSADPLTSIETDTWLDSDEYY